MGVIVSAFLYGGAVAKQVLGTPGDNVCLSRGNIDTTIGATIWFFSTVRGNLPHKPFCTAPKLLTRSPIRELRDITRRLLSSTLVLARAALTRHECWGVPLPPVIVLLEGVRLWPSTVAPVRITNGPGQVCHWVVAVPSRNFAARQSLHKAACTTT